MKIVRALEQIDDATGASLVEFALVSPVIVLLMAGVVDVGRYIWDGMLAANAARAGAVYGAQSIGTAGDSTGIKAAAVADAPQAIASPDVTPTGWCSCDSSPGVSANCADLNACPSPDHKDIYVKVTVTKTFNPLIHWPAVPTSITISKTNIEQLSN